MMPATTVEPSMIATVETSVVVAARIAMMMHIHVTIAMMPRTFKAFWNIDFKPASASLIVRTHLLNGAPVRAQMGPSRTGNGQENDNECEGEDVHAYLVAGATAAATPAATARKPAG
jgi:hypothetical protein